MLAKNDEAVLSAFASLVRERFPDARIWAFGSRTRGEARVDSDLDICVVVELLDDDVDKAIIHMAWQVGFDNNVVVSTVTYSRREFEEGPLRESPLVRSIREAGVAA